MYGAKTMSVSTSDAKHLRTASPAVLKTTLLGNLMCGGNLGRQISDVVLLVSGLAVVHV